MVEPGIEHGTSCSVVRNSDHEASDFGGLVVSILASGTQDRGFAPGRSRRSFRAKKSSARLPSEEK
jgi:hypothetical protein